MHMCVGTLLHTLASHPVLGETRAFSPRTVKKNERKKGMKEGRKERKEGRKKLICVPVFLSVQWDNSSPWFSRWLNPVMAILSTENGSVSRQTFWGVSQMRMKQTDCLQTRDQNRTKYTYTAQTRLRVVQYPAYRAIFPRNDCPKCFIGKKWDWTS